MGNHHFAVLVHKQADKYENREALRYRDYETNQWLSVTWREVSDTVHKASNALVALGVKEEENIGIFSQNKPECLYADFAGHANRAVSIPLYATSSAAQAQYIIDDAQIRFLFVGEQYQYDTAFSVLGAMRRPSFTFDPGAGFWSRTAPFLILLAKTESVTSTLIPT